MTKTKETKYTTHDPSIAFPDARHKIVFAFELGGIPFFKFNDINDVPCDRGWNALVFYNELSMRCTREFLLLHTQAFKDVVNNTKGIKITELVKLNQQLEERLNFIFEPEIAYKLCSVVFFDATENPYSYNYKHSLEKASKFMKGNMQDFFLSQPIVNLIPYINSFSKDLADYCQTVNMITTKHLENISSMLSEGMQSKELLSKAESLNTMVGDYLKSNT